jgi:hypothetical protein
VTLIQQRIAIDRARTGALWRMCSGAGLTVVFGIRAAAAPDILSWGICGLWAVFCVMGVAQLLAAGRRRVAFETENGRDAGRQEPIGRA